MNILVTGGAGFIASHIVDQLVALNHQVSIIDDLSTGKRDYLNPLAAYYETSITEDRLAEVFAQVNPEVVIHHAAQIDVQTSLQKPAWDANVNIIGTVNLLEACREFGVRKIIYASSAAVYGSPEYLPVDETHPVRPLSFYGISKHTPEHYIEAFSQLYNIDYTILRYANVYGIRQDPKGEGGVVSIFVDKLLNQSQPAIFGDGEQTRDFIYVMDIVRANIAALDRGSRSIFNVSCNEQTTVNELLQRMSEICGRPFNPQYLPQRVGDIVHSRLDNHLALQGLGWEPVYSLKDGLKETCEYYIKEYKKYAVR